MQQLPVEEEITNQGEPASQCVAPIDPVNDENQPIPEQETPELFSEPVYSLERRNSSSYDLEVSLKPAFKARLLVTPFN